MENDNNLSLYAKKANTNFMLSMNVRLNDRQIRVRTKNILAHEISNGACHGI
jgi:hypothetical protein